MILNITINLCWDTSTHDCAPFLGTEINPRITNITTNQNRLSLLGEVASLVTFRTLTLFNRPCLCPQYIKYSGHKIDDCCCICVQGKHLQKMTPNVKRLPEFSENMD